MSEILDLVSSKQLESVECFEYFFKNTFVEIFISMKFSSLKNALIMKLLHIYSYTPI